MVSQDIAMDRPRLHALESSPAYPGWRVLLGAVIGLAFSPGPMIFGSFGLFASYLQGDFGWGRGQIMLGLTFFNVGGDDRPVRRPADTLSLADSVFRRVSGDRLADP
jgi:hypothetical protein